MVRATARSDQHHYAAALADVEQVMALGNDAVREEWAPMQTWLREEVAPAPAEAPAEADQPIDPQAGRRGNAP